MRIFLTALLIFAAGSDVSYADPIDYSKYIATASIGANLFDLGDRFGDVGIESANEFMFSWGFEYRFHRNWGVEIRWAGSSGDVELAATGREADIDPMYFNGNVLYHFTMGSKFTPFVTAGLGIAVLDIDRDNRGDSETNLAYNFGGGVWVPMNNRLSLRMELRDYIYSVDGISEESAVALDLPRDFRATMNDLAFLTGVNIGF